MLRFSDRQTNLKRSTQAICVSKKKLKHSFDGVPGKESQLIGSLGAPAVNLRGGFHIIKPV